MPDPLELIDISRRCLAIGILLRSMEVLANASEVRETRLLGWWPQRSDAHNWLAMVEARASAAPVALAVTFSRVAMAAFALAVPLEHRLLPWTAGVLLVSQLYVNRRFRRIHHSADVMLVCGLAAVFVALLNPADPDVIGIALTFLGAQAMLAYLAAGLVKLRSRDWRTGATPAAIYQQGPHMFAPLGGVLAAHPGASAGAAWMVTMLELALPASLVVPTPAFLVVLSAGAAFHLSMAVLMGLHSFLWAFLAAYPGVYYLHAWFIERIYSTM